MSTVISSTAGTLGTSEKTFYAQQIIDAFSKAIDNNMCLSKIPIAVYSQLETYEQNLTDIFGTLNTPVPDGLGSQNTFNITKPVDTVTTTSNAPTTNSFVNSVISNLNSECIPCGIELPDFDLAGLFEGILNQIADFLKIAESLFDLNIPQYCHFTYFLSFLCIPDLARILAMIIARILQLSAKISLGNLSVSAFISGILGSILGAIMQVVLSVLNFAASPILCLLDSLDSLLKKLPTEQNIGSYLSPTDYQKVFGTPKPPTTDPTAQYINKLDNTYKTTTGLIVNEFKQASALINNAQGGINQVLQDLIGLCNFNTCESQRVTSVFQDVQTVVQLVQLANVLSALIKLKSKQAVINELCKYNGQNVTTSTTNPLAASDLVSVIDAVTNGVTAVIQDGQGNTVGVIVNSDASPNNDNLSLFTCNLADFIRDNTLPSIVKEVAPIAQSEIIGNGNDPQANIGPLRNIINVNDVASNPSVKAIYFNVENPDDVISQINNIFGYDPFQDKSNINYYTLVDPTTNTGKVVDSSQSIGTIAKTGNIPAKQTIIDNQIKIINGPGISKPAQIKCGSIENIKSNIGLVLENL